MFVFILFKNHFVSGTGKLSMLYFVFHNFCIIFFNSNLWRILFQFQSHIRFNVFLVSQIVLLNALNHLQDIGTEKRFVNPVENKQRSPLEVNQKSKQRINYKTNLVNQSTMIHFIFIHFSFRQKLNYKKNFF